MLPWSRVAPRKAGLATMARLSPACQDWRGHAATIEEFLTLERPRHGSAILLTDQRDGSEIVAGGISCGRQWGFPFRRVVVACSRAGDRAGPCVSDGVDRQVYLPHDACVVCVGPDQPHRRDLDYAGVAR